MDVALTSETSNDIREGIPNSLFISDDNYLILHKASDLLMFYINNFSHRVHASRNTIWFKNKFSKTFLGFYLSLKKF